MYECANTVPLFFPNSDISTGNGEKAKKLIRLELEPNNDSIKAKAMVIGEG